MRNGLDAPMWGSSSDEGWRARSTHVPVPSACKESTHQREKGGKSEDRDSSGDASTWIAGAIVLQANARLTTTRAGQSWMDNANNAEQAVELYINSTPAQN
jgi:hypothetical protein